MACTVCSRVHVVTYWRIQWRCLQYLHLWGQVLSCMLKPSLHGYVLTLDSQTYITSLLASYVIIKYYIISLINEQYNVSVSDVQKHCETSETLTKKSRSSRWRQSSRCRTSVMVRVGSATELGGHFSATNYREVRSAWLRRTRRVYLPDMPTTGVLSLVRRFISGPKRPPPKPFKTSSLRARDAAGRFRWLGGSSAIVVRVVAISWSRAGDDCTPEMRALPTTHSACGITSTAVWRLIANDGKTDVEWKNLVGAAKP